MRKTRRIIPFVFCGLLISCTTERRLARVRISQPQMKETVADTGKQLPGQIAWTDDKGEEHLVKQVSHDSVTGENMTLIELSEVTVMAKSKQVAERNGKINLDNGKSLMLALSQDLSQNRPAEAREHVRRFHELFFTLSPEKSAIEHNVKRALLLADKSVYNYYSDFAEKGYYNRIIAGNINQVLKVDSVVCDFNGYPYRAVTYATQKIIRQSNVTERSLVTTCRLLNSSRSDDNPNGFTIEGFTIIENKDLQTIKR